MSGVFSLDANRPNLCSAMGGKLLIHAYSTSCMVAFSGQLKKHEVAAVTQVVPATTQEVGLPAEMQEVTVPVLDV